jgi:Cft2 family RNA processing exonuclease
MHIQFLGGASGVGATCQLVTIGERRILVDAGVRVDSADRLPDLAALDGVALDAILITHAHADHIGALPLVAARYPATPIYATPATIRLMEVMLGDAVRVMARRAAEELELPLYDDALVAATLRQLRPLQPGAQTLRELPGVAVHAQRAGHIAGAVSLGFEAPDGRLVISGDVSATPQRTILGAALPAPPRPELLVLESTYGARLHPNRSVEERRLAEAVAAVIERGGHCLVPAFALGRAQEIILILRAAQRDGLIPPFPILVDGLVRAVCAAYAAIPEALTPALRRHILGGGRPFFSGSIRPVETPQQREQAIAGPPCAIIASSGMLTGGPSLWYAERLVERSEAAILFSGYLDEEAPGRRLLALADAPPSERRLALGTRTLAVACQLGRYSLSAHADGDELAAIVRGVQPKTVALVHGDAEARASLAARLKNLAEVVIARDGQTLAIAETVRGGRRVALPEAAVPAPLEPLGSSVLLDATGLERLWTAMRDGSGVQTFSVRELARAWYGTDIEAEQEQAIETALAAGSPFFVPLPGAPGLWRVPTPVEVRRLAAQSAAGGGQRPKAAARPDSAAITAIVDRNLAHQPDLYGRSVDPDSGAVTLRYFFPRVAAERDALLIARVAEEAGVAVSVWPQPHQGQLAAVALEVLPAGLVPERAPAIHHEAERVEVRCSGMALPEAVAAAAARFAERTGWRLVVRMPGLDATPVGAPEDETQAAFVPPDGAARSELNFALATARTWFGPDTGCYKASADQQSGVVTLRFHFPDVARVQHADALAGLAEYIGWTVRIWPQAHQDALMQAAREAVPAGLVLLGAPALQSATHEVLLKVQGEIDEQAFDTARTTFHERTGWRLVLRRAG